MNDNRQFWKTVIPFLLDDGSQCSQINLFDQDNVISYDKSLSEKFSNFFDTAVKNFDIKGPQISHVNENYNPIDFALNKSCRSSQYIENCAKSVSKDLKNTDVTPVFKKDNPVLSLL